VQIRAYEIEDLTVYVQRSPEGEFEVIAVKGKNILKVSEEDQIRVEERAIRMAERDIWVTVVNEEEE
jgi:hypothetical protein